MGSKFAKFVEFCTDSRYVPLGTRCALCSKKLGFFRTGFWSINAGKLADGVLCEKCNTQIERLLATKRDWMQPAALRKATWGEFNTRSKEEIPLKAVKEMFADKENADAECLSGFGGSHTALFRIEEAVRIEPTALQVGIARAKRLRSKVAVFGMVERGSFSRHDVVHLKQQDASVDTTILEAYAWDCEENTLEIDLCANMGKHRLVEGKQGWLVLDYESDVDEDAFVVR